MVAAAATELDPVDWWMHYQSIDSIDLDLKELHLVHMCWLLIVVHDRTGDDEDDDDVDSDTDDVECGDALPINHQIRNHILPSLLIAQFCHQNYPLWLLLSPFLLVTVQKYKHL